MDIRLFTHVVSELLVETARTFWKLRLNEDMGAIRSGGGHQMIVAKQALHETAKYISYASFIIAQKPSDSDREEIAKFHAWMSDAQLAAFCLEDQIAMYANQGLDDRELYAMKKAIGMFTIKELTKEIQAHCHRDKMPMELQIMAKVSENSPFVGYSHHVTADKILGMVDEATQVRRFLDREDNPKVLFIIGLEGSGKTTLMDKVYKDCDVNNKFKVCSRVNVSETRGLVGLLKEVLEGSNVDLEHDATNEFKILKKIQETFKDGSYLIVLDNVQDTSILYSLMHVLKDSDGKIIVLTRRTDIERSLDRGYLVDGQYEEVRILPLNENRSRWLLRFAAFPEYAGTVTEDDSDPLAALSLPATSMVKLNKILLKCQGNPWNIWTVGKLLRTYDPGCRSGVIVERIDGIIIRPDDERDPPINLEEAKRHPPIQLEEAKLEDAKSPGDVRLGFLYCLAFPNSSEIKENAGIPKRKLIRMWTAEGFLQDSPHQSQEQEAEDLFEELIKRKLLVVKKTSVDGKVLKCSVNENIKPLAMDMCERQKFCRFLPSSDHEASSACGTRAERSQASSSFGNLLTWRKKTVSDKARYRMIAVHGDGGVKTASTALAKDIRLRSLLYFRTETTERQKLELSFRRSYRLLRTLELQGAHLDRLPSSISNLICLRYLGLRGTQLEFLPRWLQRLRHLMCLDIRDTNITRLEDVSAFTEMRHLLLANSFRDRSVQILNGLKFLIYLQTLSGAKQGLPSDLEHLQFLRKLSVKKAQSASSEAMCRAISMMKFLRSLTVTSDGAQFDVRSLKIGRNLHKLKLGGDMGALCDYRLSMMRSITYLYLWNSNLQDDPLCRLQDLKHLLLLSLCNAYLGVELRCTRGYHKLKKLSVISMEQLTECTFATGAMKKLEELVFVKCEKLQSPPAGLHEIQPLKEVHLAQMLPDFCKQMTEILGTEKVKLVDMDFHKSRRGVNEGSQITADEPSPAPATIE